jgi:L-gulono-1,4-lactone dehydrogenase
MADALRPPPACGATNPRWVNWAKTQEVYPREVRCPTTLAELRAIVKDVTGRGGRMKAVATGLSFSDILQTEDTLVVVTGLKGEGKPGVLLPCEEELWHEPTPLEPRVRIVCGARIRELNAALASAGLAFTNLGGFDAQTMVGAISTSTHGSGRSLGPLPNAVRSLDLVTTGGAMFRIERTHGITDRKKFEKRYSKSEMTLVQDDRWFQAVVVSLGCMGVVYSVTMAVSPAYRLAEYRRAAVWDEVRASLSKSDALLRQFRHFEVELNPYPRSDGKRECVLTERDYASPGAPTKPLPLATEIAEEVVFTPKLQHDIARIINSEPQLVPEIISGGLKAVANRHHLDDSYKIYNVGRINYAKVLSGEYFFPLEGNVYLHAVDRLLETIAKNQKRGLYQTCPFTLRFVAESEAFLSMAHKRPSCAVEIPVFTEGIGAFEVLLSYEEALAEFQCRPHWGQLHELTGAPGWLKRAYPAAGEWIDVYRQLNCAGMFDNHFTDRLGISAKPRGQT